MDDLEKQKFEEYKSISWQILIYVCIGFVVALIFDKFGWIGYLPEGIVRAIAGTGDTLGLMLAAFIAFSRKKKIKGGTWIAGGLIGLAIAFAVQAIVFHFADPYGPFGVIHAYAFSNLDNTFAGAAVLIAALSNHGIKEGWHRYWRHPFFVGNAIMLVIIPVTDLILRIFVSFRPDMNYMAVLEAGIMDVDSFGAALIFLVAVRFGVRVPHINDSLKGLWKRT